MHVEFRSEAHLCEFFITLCAVFGFGLHGWREREVLKTNEGGETLTCLRFFFVFVFNIKIVIHGLAKSYFIIIISFLIFD